jgi:hypothetical protein
LYVPQLNLNPDHPKTKKAGSVGDPDKLYMIDLRVECFIRQFGELDTESFKVLTHERKYPNQGNCQKVPLSC